MFAVPFASGGHSDADIVTVTPTPTVTPPPTVPPGHAPLPDVPNSPAPTPSPTPTPSPVPVPEPAPVPRVQEARIVVPADAIQALVCSYAWDCWKALNVMWCESGGRPNAVNPAGYYGLFQLDPDHGGPEFWDNWMIPEYNVALAYAVYQSAVNRGVWGWSPWGCA